MRPEKGKLPLVTIFSRDFYRRKGVGFKLLSLQMIALLVFSFVSVHPGFCEDKTPSDLKAFIQAAVEIAAGEAVPAPVMDMWSAISSSPEATKLALRTWLDQKMGEHLENTPEDIAKFNKYYAIRQALEGNAAPLQRWDDQVKGKIPIVNNVRENEALTATATVDKNANSDDYVLTVKYKLLNLTPSDKRNLRLAEGIPEKSAGDSRSQDSPLITADNNSGEITSTFTPSRPGIYHWQWRLWLPGHPELPEIKHEERFVVKNSRKLNIVASVNPVTVVIGDSVNFNLGCENGSGKIHGEGTVELEDGSYTHTFPPVDLTETSPGSGNYNPSTSTWKPPQTGKYHWFPKLSSDAGDESTTSVGFEVLNKPIPEVLLTPTLDKTEGQVGDVFTLTMNYQVSGITPGSTATASESSSIDQVSAQSTVPLPSNTRTLTPTTPKPINVSRQLTFKATQIGVFDWRIGVDIPSIGGAANTLRFVVKPAPKLNIIKEELVPASGPPRTNFKLHVDYTLRGMDPSDAQSVTEDSNITSVSSGAIVQTFATSSKTINGTSPTGTIDLNWRGTTAGDYAWNYTVDAGSFGKVTKTITFRIDDNTKKTIDLVSASVTPTSGTLGTTYTLNVRYKLVGMSPGERVETNENSYVSLSKTVSLPTTHGSGTSDDPNDDMSGTFTPEFNGRHVWNFIVDAPGYSTLYGSVPFDVGEIAPPTANLSARLDYPMLTLAPGETKNCAVYISNWQRNTGKPVVVNYPDVKDGWGNLSGQIQVFPGNTAMETWSMSGIGDFTSEYSCGQGYRAKETAPPGITPITIVVSQEGAGSVKLTLMVKVVKRGESTLGTEIPLFPPLVPESPGSDSPGTDTPGTAGGGDTPAAPSTGLVPGGTGPGGIGSGGSGPAGSGSGGSGSGGTGPAGSGYGGTTTGGTGPAGPGYTGPGYNGPGYTGPGYNGPGYTGPGSVPAGQGIGGAGPSGSGTEGSTSGGTGPSGNGASGAGSEGNTPGGIGPSGTAPGGTSGGTATGGTSSGSAQPKNSGHYVVSEITWSIPDNGMTKRVIESASSNNSKNINTSPSNGYGTMKVAGNLRFSCPKDILLDHKYDFYHSPDSDLPHIETSTTGTVKVNSTGFPPSELPWSGVAIAGDEAESIKELGEHSATHTWHTSIVLHDTIKDGYSTDGWPLALSGTGLLVRFDAFSDFIEVSDVKYVLQQGSTTNEPAKQIKAWLDKDVLELTAGKLPSEIDNINIQDYKSDTAEPVQVIFPGQTFGNKLPNDLAVDGGSGAEDPPALNAVASDTGVFSWSEIFRALPTAKTGTYQVPIIVRQVGAGEVRLTLTVKVLAPPKTPPPQPPQPPVPAPGAGGGRRPSSPNPPAPPHPGGGSTGPTTPNPPAPPHPGGGSTGPTTPNPPAPPHPGGGSTGPTTPNPPAPPHPGGGSTGSTTPHPPAPPHPGGGSTGPTTPNPPAPPHPGGGSTGPTTPNPPVLPPHTGVGSGEPGSAHTPGTHTGGGSAGPATPHPRDPFKPFDLNGTWVGQLSGGTERTFLHVSQAGASVQAIKISKGKYVTRGQISFEGRYTGKTFAGRGQSADEGYQNPRWEPISITVPDANTIQVKGTNEYASTTFQRTNESPPPDKPAHPDSLTGKWYGGNGTMTVVQNGTSVTMTTATDHYAGTFDGTTINGQWDSRPTWDMAGTFQLKYDREKDCLSGWYQTDWLNGPVTGEKEKRNFYADRVKEQSE